MTKPIFSSKGAESASAARSRLRSVTWLDPGQRSCSAATIWRDRFSSSSSFKPRRAGALREPRARRRRRGRPAHRRRQVPGVGHDLLRLLTQSQPAQNVADADTQVANTRPATAPLRVAGDDRLRGVHGHMLPHSATGDNRPSGREHRLQGSQRERQRVGGRSAPSRLTRRARSKVRIWSSTIRPCLP